MPRVVNLQPDKADESLPPTFYLKFSQEEFPAFLANPTGVMTELGQPVNNLVVTVKDHVWDARNMRWVTEATDKLIAENGGGAPAGDDAGLPPAKNWEWWCGYQDEMCVCERVLVP